MKYLNRNTLVSFALGLILSFGIVYAATNITSLSQTAVTGDKVTSDWVNAVNMKLGTVDAAATQKLGNCVTVRQAAWQAYTCTGYISTMTSYASNSANAGADQMIYSCCPYAP